jgi:putative nucleotidyltransferase with HDIG domain
LKHSFKGSLGLLVAVATGFLGLFLFTAFSFYIVTPPTLVWYLAYGFIALASLLFSWRGVFWGTLLAFAVVGVVGVQEGRVVLNATWWQQGSLYLLFGLAVGSWREVVAWHMERVKDSSLAVATKATGDTQALSDLATLLKSKGYVKHIERVAQNAFVLGREMGLSVAELETLYWAALLHDVGKLSVSEELLLRESRNQLTELEYAQIKRHAEYGAELIANLSPDFNGIANAVKHHHERWDGGGYPEGLSGRTIPRLSRMIAVVDVFEALTSERPYREPMAVEKAVQCLEQLAEKQFDPETVKVFKACFERGEIRYAQPKPTKKAPEKAPVAKPEREKVNKD